jgi:hypothetical protein
LGQASSLLRIWLAEREAFEPERLEPGVARVEANDGDGGRVG